MEEKTKGMLLGATMVVLLVLASGAVLAKGRGLTDEQRAMLLERKAELSSENVSPGEYSAAMREYAKTIGVDGGCQGFADEDGDGVCDNASDCPMHADGGGCVGVAGGCHGPEGCPRMKLESKGGCHGGVSASGCPLHKTGDAGESGAHQGCPYHNR
jgi:hypothetical protein